MEENLDYGTYFSPESVDEAQPEAATEEVIEESNDEQEINDGSDESNDSYGDYGESEPSDNEEDPGEQTEDSEETTSARTPEETKRLAAEFFKVAPDRVIVDKNGEPRIIVTVNGRKRSVSAEEYGKGFNLNQAGYEKLNQGKKMIKDFQGFLGQVKENPSQLFWSLADKMGLSKEQQAQLAEQFLQGRLDEYEMTDEQRHTKTLEQKLQEAEAKEAHRKQLEDAHRLEQEKIKEMNSIGQELVSSMTELGFKPADTGKNSTIMYNAVRILEDYHHAGQELSPKQAVQIAMRKFQDNTIDIFQDMSDDHIVSILPENVIKAIRKADINRLKKGTPPAQEYESGQEIQLEDYEANNEPIQRRGRKQLSVSDYFDNL